MQHLHNTLLLGSGSLAKLPLHGAAGGALEELQVPLLHPVSAAAPAPHRTAVLALCRNQQPRSRLYTVCVDSHKRSSGSDHEDDMAKNCHLVDAP